MPLSLPSHAPWVTGEPADQPGPLPARRAPKKCFFQKHDAGTSATHVHHVGDHARRTAPDEPYLFIENVEGLLTCVQMGTIEFHGWGARVEDIEKPDRLVFDLDPGAKGSISPPCPMDRSCLLFPRSAY